MEEVNQFSRQKEESHMRMWRINADLEILEDTRALWLFLALANWQPFSPRTTLRTSFFRSPIAAGQERNGRKRRKRLDWFFCRRKLPLLLSGSLVPRIDFADKKKKKSKTEILPHVKLTLPAFERPGWPAPWWGPSWTWRRGCECHSRRPDWSRSPRTSRRCWPCRSGTFINRYHRVKNKTPTFTNILHTY